MKVEFDCIQKIHEMESKDYGFNTCFDYIDSIEHDGNRWIVTVFVEPCGYIKRWGPDLLPILNWFDEQFTNQPIDFDYIQAGWTFDLHREKAFDENENAWGESK